MSLDKLSITLYDLLGYLLPGYLLLLACSVAEASFFSSNLFALSKISSNPISNAIAAYFLGQVSHAISSILKFKRHKWFDDGGRYALKPEITKEVDSALKDSYTLNVEGDRELSKIETYLLADNYILASGGSTERDILTAREGFFKASMVAFGALAIIVALTLLSRSPRLQVQPDFFIQIHKLQVVISAVVFFSLAWLFRARFIFFNRAKNNNALLTFLALYTREKRELLRQRR